MGFFCLGVSSAVGVFPGARMRLAAAILALPIVARYAVMFASWFVGRMHPEPPPPRLERLPDDVDREVVLVAMPVVVESPQHVQDVLSEIGYRATADADPMLRYVLLVDPTDAAAADADDDRAIVREAQAMVDRINALLADEFGDKVFAVHRRREWSETQQRWISWERKRGSVLQFMQLAQHGVAMAHVRHVCGDLTGLLARRRARYVFVHDEGTWCDGTGVRELLHVALHPENRLVRDRVSGRRLSGFGIFQPVSAELVPRRASFDRRGDERIVVSSSAGGVGVHRDAIFEGKGLIDMERCLPLLSSAFPEGVVLHHDLVEGFVVGAATVPSVFLFCVSTSGVARRLARGSRWLRGYVQLLPWLAPRPRDASGARTPNPISGAHRFRLATLILMECSPPASLLAVVLGLVAGTPAGVILAVLAMPSITAVLAGLALWSLAGIVRSVRLALGVGQPPNPRIEVPVHRLAAATLHLLLLPRESLTVVLSIVTACWRLLVSRRNLLEWSTRRAGWSGARESIGAYFRDFWWNGAAGLASILLALYVAPSTSVMLVALGGAWLVSPLLFVVFDRVVLDV